MCPQIERKPRVKKGNLVRLSKAEWNSLVEKIKKGELDILE